MARTRALPSDWRETARSAVPLGLLALAAAFPVLRLPVLLALVAGSAVAINRDAAVRWTWAAGIPVAISLAWGTWLEPVAGSVAPLTAVCGSLTSPVMVWRVTEAAVVLAGVAVLASVLKSSRSSLGLRMPARPVVRWSIIGFLVAVPAALLLGPILAEPFFGDVGYDLTVVGAIVPALVFAIANGSMEELAYRGAMLGWSAKVIGTWPAVVGQAIVFGLAHSGSDVVANGIPLMLALGVGGLIAGVLTVRTRSLLLPMAVHIGLDIPIYYAFACSP